ncbi:RNA-binding domain superfamily [Arabidopsis thaliana x Arabidopsis arenosa]|uniref:RNA-binding domain superfamily n=1 Tax=Arabidopsis thaliana x Arabidopsis arenosa TaxID=1240361 RepID=A0A8T2ARF7_9BRAS|nr:RNA-binding domain superfamily [Arabidopsis thaliana x Arabidopsis arenosa]
MRKHVRDVLSFVAERLGRDIYFVCSYLDWPESVHDLENLLLDGHMSPALRFYSLMGMRLFSVKIENPHLLAPTWWYQNGWCWAVGLIRQFEALLKQNGQLEPDDFQQLQQLYFAILEKVIGENNITIKEVIPGALVNLSMDDKGMEVKGSSRESREIGRIIVTGYGNKLPLEHVEKELRKLYASCGEITDVFIPTTRKSSLWRSGFVYFVGEGAVDKALQLNGSDMGGWTVCAEAYPFPEEDDNCVELEVKGYDTSLSESDIKCELSKLFSSCGKIVQAIICKSFSIVFLVGVDAVEKAPKLSGTDMGGGHKVVVRFVSYRGRTTMHPRRHKGVRNRDDRTEVIPHCRCNKCVEQRTETENKNCLAE